VPVRLLDWFRELITGPPPDHPLSEREREEPQPSTAWDARARTEQEWVGNDFDPDEPRSGRL